FLTSYFCSARSCTISCTAATAMDRAMAGTVVEANHEPRTRDSSVRGVVAGRDRLSRVHHLRVQLFQTEDQTGLANFQWFCGVHRRAIRRDVRLPANDLLVVPLAHPKVPRHRSVWGMISVTSGIPCWASKAIRTSIRFT